MSEIEPRMIWPDPSGPMIVRRGMTVNVSNGNGRERPPVSLLDVPVEVLVNGSLYFAVEDREGLREGDVISRNLALTEDSGGDVGVPADQRMIVYAGVYRALRGIGHIRPQYDRVEVPRLYQWQQTLRWLLQVSWTLQHATPEEIAAYASGTLQLTLEFGAVRDDEKVAARDRTTASSSLTDRRGVHNVNRLPPLLWSSDMALGRRIVAIRGKGRRMDWRAMVLAHYLDRLLQICRSIHHAALERRKSDAVFGAGRTRQNALRAAVRMRDYAFELRTIHAQPFRRSLHRVADDLEVVAIHLETGSLRDAQAVLGRIHRSMVLMTEYHRRLEEILVVVSRVHHLHIVPPQQEIRTLQWELRSIHKALARSDLETGERWEDGFKLGVLPHVLSQVGQARGALARREGADIEGAYEHLKQAADPF